MPDWLTQTGLTQALGTSEESGPLQIAVRLGIAFLAGCLIAAIYRLVRPRQQAMATFPATLVLLSILCAMLPLVIGQNVAWAFGLVGALSIVRFRTVVEDTHDITFVIFAVLVGMAVGASQLTVALVGIAVTGAAAFLVRPRGERRRNVKWAQGNARLSIRFGVGRDPEEIFAGVRESLLDHVELVSGGTGKQGVSLDLVYEVRLKVGTKPTDLINHINLVEGVRSVNLRRGR